MRPAAILSLALMLAVPSPAARSVPSKKPLVPGTGAYFGAYVQPAVGAVDEFEALVERKLALSLHYYYWQMPFPRARELDDRANGRIPVITWMPRDSSTRRGISLASIAGGTHDRLIATRARELRRFRGPVFLRWAHEMNGSWEPWSGHPVLYVAAWRRIWTIFQRERARNVAFLWSPEYRDQPRTPRNHWTRYYPGDDYVDWVGIDGYNRYPSRWKAIAPMFQPIYDEYVDRKPVMIAETASVEDAKRPGRKAAWIGQVRQTIKDSFPELKAFMWFHAIKKGIDWRVDTSPSSLEAYRAMGADPYFNPQP